MFTFRIGNADAVFDPKYNYITLGPETFEFNDTEKKLKERVYLKITEDCNLSCIYCFQKKDSKDLTKKISIRSYEELIKSEVNEKNKEITLFGGEPFLEENIETISYIFNWINTDNKVLAFSNGNFEESIFDLLNENKNKINNITISIDGPEKIHNSRRINKYKNSYKTIMDNCKKMLRKKIPFSIQINIDSSNIAYVAATLQELKYYLGEKDYSVEINRVLGMKKTITEKEILELYIELYPNYLPNYLRINSNTLLRVISFFTNEGYISDRCNLKGTKVYDFIDSSIYTCPQNKESCIGSFDNNKSNFNYEQWDAYQSKVNKDNLKCGSCVFYHFCSEGCINEKIDYSLCEQKVQEKLNLIFRNFNLFFREV